MVHTFPFGDVRSSFEITGSATSNYEIFVLPQIMKYSCYLKLWRYRFRNCISDQSPNFLKQMFSHGVTGPTGLRSIRADAYLNLALSRDGGRPASWLPMQRGCGHSLNRTRIVESMVLVTPGTLLNQGNNRVSLLHGCAELHGETQSQR